jgi:hypothetical protein
MEYFTKIVAQAIESAVLRMHLSSSIRLSANVPEHPAHCSTQIQDDCTAKKQSF